MKKGILSLILIVAIFMMSLLVVEASALKNTGEECTTNVECKSGLCNVNPEADLTLICTACRTNADCGTGKTCTVATGICRTATSRAAYDAPCAQNSDCASNVCR
ncbi:MAG: hypothetical protein V1734_04395, partial [Nanoarchaeota archaeon]